MKHVTLTVRPWKAAWILVILAIANHYYGLGAAVLCFLASWDIS